MALMHPPSLKPLNSLRSGSRARKQIPFFQPRRPFLSIFPEECQQIQLPKITDSRGSLSFIEGERHIPFKIRSAYWISNIAGTMTPKENPNEGRQEFIIPLTATITGAVPRYTIYSGLLPPLLLPARRLEPDLACSAGRRSGWYPDSRVPTRWPPGPAACQRRPNFFQSCGATCGR